MELLILAAGRGSRLGKLTDEIPKGLLKINGNSIIQRQIDIIKKELKIEKINIATGYKSEKFSEIKNVGRLLIKNWDQFNMVGTFLHAIKFREIDLSKDLLLTYGDILIKENFFNNFEFKNKFKIVLPIIDDWEKQWGNRYEDPLSDLETLKYDSNFNLTEIGKRPTSFDEIMGQFAGVIFIPRNEIKNFIKVANLIFSKNRKADMTGLLYELLKQNNLIEVSKVPDSTWYEIDTLKDFEYAINNEKIK